MLASIQILQAVVDLRQRLPEGSHAAATGVIEVFLSFLLGRTNNHLHPGAPMTESSDLVLWGRQLRPVLTPLPVKPPSWPGSPLSFRLAT